MSNYDIIILTKAVNEMNATIQAENFLQEEKTSNKEYYIIDIEIADILPDKNIVMPLKDCLDEVKELKNQIPSPDNFVKAHNKCAEEDYAMRSYFLNLAEKLRKEGFCKHSYIFNIETENYTIPKDIKNYYAVHAQIIL